MSYFGSTKIGRMFLGGTEIAKAYLGSDLVFQKAAPGPVVPITDTLNVNPYSLINKNTDGAYYSLVNYANPYGASETATTYAEIHLVRGSGAITYVYYLFDTSSIPADATIDSVECKAKVFISNGTSTNIATRKVQMFSGTTAKGTAQNATTTAGVRTFSGVTWTRAEISDARIRFYAVRGTKNTNADYYFRFYGATLSVTYTYMGQQRTVNI